MKIQTKFFFLSVFCGVCVSILIAINFWHTTLKVEHAKTMSLITTVTQRHMECDMMHDAIRGDVLTAIVAQNKKDFKGIEQAQKDLEEHSANFRKNIDENIKSPVPAGTQKLLQKLSLALILYNQKASELIKIVAKEQDHTEKYTVFEQQFKLLEEENEALSENIEEWSKSFEQESIATSHTFNLFINIISLLAIFCAAMVPVYSWRSIFRPLGKMSDAMRELTGGNTRITIPKTKSHDEMGKIASSIQIFKDTAIKNIELEKESIAVAQKSEEEKKRALQEREEAVIKEITSIIQGCTNGDFSRRTNVDNMTGLMLFVCKGLNHISSIYSDNMHMIKNVLENMAKGDLTQKITGNHKGLFLEIQQCINTTIEKLSDIVIGIETSAQSINASAKSLDKGSRDLSERTESQARDLDHATTSMDDLTQKIRKNTEGAKEANLLSKQSSHMAQKGNDVVTSTIDSMKKIQESSQKVSDIIVTVDEIAFQTNLLALNAAVEAARAGEAGKGFAVVSSEVRALAGKSAEASKEIKELISHSIRQVNDGMNLVTESGNSLKAIVDSIGNVSKCIDLIAKGSEEQTSGVDAINTVIGGIDASTQKNSVVAQENWEATNTMFNQATTLLNLISFFKISNRAGGSAIPHINLDDYSEQDAYDAKGVVHTAH
ncbi:MAG: HAMP domain-containing protein [Alphaproteobacteria bacterium]|nr:HAMP domain-containing protein [Alphaproteobacteria bacterium]